MSETKVSAAEMRNGNIRMRQGGNVNDWSNPGTTDYAIEKTDVTVEDGVAPVVSGTVTVVYPIPFDYSPHLQLTLNSADDGATVRKITESATGFTAKVEKPNTAVSVLGINVVSAGSIAATGKVDWTAKGKASTP